MVKAVKDRMKKDGVSPMYVEGFNGTGWIVLDYGDVVAHFFTEESRRYYSLERLWADGSRVEWRPKSPAVR